MTQTPVRHYAATAESTKTFGRVLVSARDQHIIIDGPVQNGCPGEAMTPPEAFLGGVASCGVELMHVIAKEQNIGLKNARVEITGAVDRANQSRKDVTLFNSVRLKVMLQGVNHKDAQMLVESFKGR